MQQLLTVAVQRCRVYVHGIFQFALFSVDCIFKIMLRSFAAVLQTVRGSLCEHVSLQSKVEGTIACSQSTGNNSSSIIIKVHGRSLQDKLWQKRGVPEGGYSSVRAVRSSVLVSLSDDFVMHKPDDEDNDLSVILQSWNYYYWSKIRKATMCL